MEFPNQPNVFLQCIISIIFITLAIPAVLSQNNRRSSDGFQTVRTFGIESTTFVIKKRIRQEYYL